MSIFGRLPFLLLAAAAGPAAAGDQLAAAIEPVVKEVGAFLRAQGKRTVAVGEIAAAPAFRSSGGAGLREALKNALQANGVAIRADGAAYTLAGKFGSPLNSGELELDLVLETDVGKVAKSFTTRITDDLVVASLAGLTTALPADRTPPIRKRLLKLSLDNGPEVSVRGTRVSARPGSPFGVEMLVLKDGGGDQHAPVAVIAGAAFVEVVRGARFAVRLVNDADFAAACTLTVDGLNSFAFSENKAVSFLVVPAKSSAVVHGWHVRGRTEEPFRAGVFPPAEGEGARRVHLGPGMLTVSFRAAWPPTEAGPADEGAGKRMFDDAPTGRGARAGDFSEHPYLTGVLREAVTVRYVVPPTAPPGQNPGGPAEPLP